MNILNTNGVKFSKKPTDPLISTNEYIYSRLAHGNAYQIKADWEGKDISLIESDIFNIIEKSYAISGKPDRSYINGNYNGVVVKTQTGGNVFVIATPSIITSEIPPIENTISTVDITTLKDKILFHKESNS